MARSAFMSMGRTAWRSNAGTGGIQIPQRADCRPARDRTARRPGRQRRGSAQIETVRGHAGSIGAFGVENVHRPISDVGYSDEGTLAADADSRRSPVASDGFSGWRVGHRCLRAAGLPSRVSSTICLVRGLPPSNRRGCLSFLISTPRPPTRQATLPRSNHGDRSCCTNCSGSKRPSSSTKRSIISRSRQTWPSCRMRDRRP